MEKRIERIIEGLKCDNIKCDWLDENIKVEDYKDYLNMACPKCNKNILTEEDYLNVLKLNDIFNFINSLTNEQLKDIEEHPEFKKVDLGLEGIKDGDKIVMHFNLHKGITIEKIEKLK